MSVRRHILFISSWYPVKNNPTHGIFNRYFAEAAALFNTVSVLHVSSATGQQNEFEFEALDENGIYTLRVYYKKITGSFPFVSQWQKYSRRNKAALLGYEKLVAARGKPDLIHLNVVLPAGMQVSLLSQKYKLPYVVNENWSGYCEEDGNYKGAFQKYFTQKVIKRAGAILPTSTFLMDAMLSHHLKGSYTVVPNVVDTGRFVPGPPPPGDKIKLVHISSLTDREKNVSGIIRAFAKARQKKPALELAIVGEGEERSTLEMLAKQCDQTNSIIFKGRLLGKALVDELNASHALIMFSHFETFCLVIAEAFACGKPVLTSDAGAIKSYMRPELGIMVQKGHEAQLTEAILVFAAHPAKYDATRIRDFAVENYSYGKVGSRLKAIYENVLRGSGGTPESNLSATNA